MPDPIVDLGANRTGALDGVYVTNERPIDMYPSLFESYPETTPLTVMFNKFGQKAATQETIYWAIKRDLPYLFHLAAAAASGATSITLTANGAAVQKNTQLYNVDKDEIALVSADGSSNTLTVSKGAAGTTGVAWEAGDILVSLLPAETEGSTEYSNIHYVPASTGYNYEQLVRIQFGMTRSADKVSTHFGGPGSKMQENEQQHYRLARYMSEFQTIYGGRASSGTGTSALRMAGGLRQYLAGGTNYIDFNGAFTESAFNNWIESYLNNNQDLTGNVVFAASRHVIRKFNDWGRQAIQISPRSTEYGLSLKTYIGGDIDIDLVPMPLLTHGAMKGHGFILDPNKVKIVPLDKMALHKDLLGFEKETRYDLFREISSMMVADERAHAMCVGATN